MWRPRRSNCRAGLRIAGAALTVAACAAAAQSHESTEGDYTLRSSTVSSMSIDSHTAQQHGIHRSRDTGLVNVVILRKGSVIPVAGRVTVTARSLTGRAENIDMKEVGANGGVSYTGTYSVVPGEVLDFTERAQPRTSRSAELSLTFRDRMWP